jgi:hypothetical protein
MLLDDDEGRFEFEVHGAGLLQVRSLLEEAGLLCVRSLLEAVWEAAAAGVGRVSNSITPCAQKQGPSLHTAA